MFDEYGRWIGPGNGPQSLGQGAMGPPGFQGAQQPQPQMQQQAQALAQQQEQGRVPFPLPTSTPSAQGMESMSFAEQRWNDIVADRQAQVDRERLSSGLAGMDMGLSRMASALDGRGEMMDLGAPFKGSAAPVLGNQGITQLLAILNASGAGGWGR